jgi:hypothetical protein
MKQRKRCYGYKHWTLEECPRCFYVGKGVAGRAESDRSRNHKWHAVVKRFSVRVEICVGPIANDAALQWEIENIAAEKTFSATHEHDCDDIGCNFTIGGDGVVGRRQTAAERAFRSQRMKQHFAANPDAKMVTSKALVERWADPTFRDKWHRRREQRIAVRARVRDEAHFKRKKSSQAEIVSMTALYASGLSLRAIAINCGVSVNRVKARLRAGDVMMRKRGG